eukprot:scaffold24258_cov79-Phaeocystis_antarctica.AAC.1
MCVRERAGACLCDALVSCVSVLRSRLRQFQLLVFGPERNSEGASLNLSTIRLPDTRQVFSPLRLTFSLSVSTIPRAGRVGAQRLRVAWFYPNEYSADAWSAPPRHTCGICGRREGFKLSIHKSIFRRQGGVKEKGTSPTCLFETESATNTELTKLTPLCVALLGTLSQRQLLF